MHSFILYGTEGNFKQVIMSFVICLYACLYQLKFMAICKTKKELKIGDYHSHANGFVLRKKLKMC